MARKLKRKRIGENLELVWEPQNRRRLDRLKSSSYLILNQKRILTPPILFDFKTPNLVLREEISSFYLNFL
jgi:hypothetical protein